jgi:hypothetical protein
LKQALPVAANFADVPLDGRAGVSDDSSSGSGQAMRPVNATPVPRRGPTRQQFARELADALRDLPVLLTAPLYRKWHLQWGATPLETHASLLGDALLTRPRYRSTRAITIDAPPETVWPWLVQVGCQRADFYSNDLLDNLARPSATTIVPAFQNLEVGQWVPMSPFTTPTQSNALRVDSFVVHEWILWTTPL